MKIGMPREGMPGEEEDREHGWPFDSKVRSERNESSPARRAEVVRRARIQWFRALSRKRDEAGVRPGDIKSLTDIHKLPSRRARTFRRIPFP